MEKIGTRCKVMHGKALQTTGGLTKKDLKYNKHGDIVSKKVSNIAKKEKRLVKAGYVTQKGQFGSIKVGGMYQDNDNDFGSPQKSHTKSIPKDPRTQQKYNRNIEAMNDIIEQIMGSNYNKGPFQSFKNRKNYLSQNSRKDSLNPNNRIFIDKEHKRVYKFGLWDECIKNEYIAYSLLNIKYNNNKHYSKMFGCELIPDSNYALLVIEYKENIIEYSSNNSNNWNNDFVNKAKKYLSDSGIKDHDEIRGNLFYYMDNNIPIFYWIDFEASLFTSNAMNKLKNNNLIKKKLINNNNNNNKKPRGLFGNNSNSNSNNDTY